MRDLAYDLVGNAAKITYGDLPKDVVEITKKFILDTFATMVAGSSAVGCGTVVDQIKDWGGKEESTILVYGGKVPSPNAAFANSVMAHALDFDDIHDEAIVHANVSVLPAALAVAELVRNVSGKDLIAAVAVGIDLMCRLSLGTVGPSVWVTSSTAGYFGAAVAAGKILGLDEDKLHHALGIAYSQCAGNVQVAVDGALAKRMQPAFAARGGIASAIFAQRGITGARNIFEGQYGFFPVYLRGKYVREKVIEGLGKVFEGKNLSAKPYPCCRYTHPAIDATLDIIQKNNIGPEDIVDVVAHVTQNVYDVVGKPFEIRESPQVDAQFSIPYTVSVAIAKRDVFIDNFSETKIKADTRVLQLSKKVKVVADQNPIGKGMVPCVVDIKTKANKTHSQRVEIIRGDPAKPLSFEDIAQKFRKCAAFSAHPVARVEEIIRAAKNLEAITGVGEVFSRLFTPQEN